MASVVIGSEGEVVEVGIVSGACTDFDVCIERAAVVKRVRKSSRR